MNFILSGILVLVFIALLLGIILMLIKISNYITIFDNKIETIEYKENILDIVEERNKELEERKNWKPSKDKLYLYDLYNKE